MKATLRRAQLIQTFGVGAIFSAGGETFVVKDISKWPIKNSKQVLDFPRLSQALGKRLISYKSEKDNREFVPVARFPTWRFCTKCKSLTKSSVQNDIETNDVSGLVCSNPNCNSKKPLSPMRFVAYCDNGHMAEINWAKYAHKDGDRECKRRDALYFDAGGRSGGDFSEMVVGCYACNSKTTLSRITGEPLKPWFQDPYPEIAYQREQNCCGTQPWLTKENREKADECSADMNVEMRGSATLYRPFVISALDIRNDKKTGSEATKAERRAKREILRRIRADYKGEMQDVLLVIKGDLDDEDIQEDIQDMIDDEVAHADMPIREGVLKEILISELSGEISTDEGHAKVDSDEDIQSDLYREEYEVFSAGNDVNSKNLTVEFEGCDSKLFKRIGRVKWLREVRVFRGFKRGRGDQTILPDVFGIADWLPSIEAIGEGIYFELNDTLINDWLKSGDKMLLERVSQQLERLESLQKTFHLGIENSEYFLLAHTLSHLIMNDLIFRSGYSSSALRERIYVDPVKNTAGILIYTTDTDSEGTLGGLVDQGRKELLSELLANIQEKAAWCSADPICRENSKQGVEGTNDSACHCCSLVSETSCAYQNSGLNRIMLSGLGEKFNEPLGLFEFMKGAK